MIESQVDRMLKDPKGEAMVTGFATQWLKAFEFDRFSPDKGLYRSTYYTIENEGVNEDLNAEPLEFFREILNKDLSVLNFLDSDWTMLNQRLVSLLRN